MRTLLLSTTAAVVFTVSAFAEPTVDFQPLAAQVRRVTEALDALGEPLTADRKGALDAALASGDATRVHGVLEPLTLFVVNINPELRVKVAPGPAKAQLVEAGWRQFLVKVVNEAGATAPLRASSPQGQKVYASKYLPPGQPQPPLGEPPGSERWLDLALPETRPLAPKLSGLGIEYRIISLYSRDPGKREARFSFDVGQGTQDLGFRAEADILFDCAPAHDITLRVKDEHGDPATGCFLIRDSSQRVYPSQSKRLAPDFFFHPQIYRDDGGKIRLPDGKYTIEFTRGPESLAENRTVTVTPATKEIAFQVKRWIDPAATGWWSGDHHIHAAGCAHYTNPSEGVHAPDMALHCRGEDLKVGANLTWGPCFDYQKQFFTGKEDKVSKRPYILRYDVEVSGFGSHQSGHLCLLRLKDQMYPGGDSSLHWPTLGLNTLRWAKKQGAVVGPAHSGWGLKLPDNALPNYNVPPFDAIGACEYIMDVTHDVEGPDGKPVPAVDFISTVDTPAIWELNIWYHTLNAGFRTRISGETDFPCIYGERVGLGRSYVKLDGPLEYDAWCEGIRKGRCYVSDGRAHLMDFKVDGLGVGETRPNDLDARKTLATLGPSELRFDAPKKVAVTVRAAALLPEKPDPKLRGLGTVTGAWGKADEKPFWHVERARVPGTREVPVELLVNGEPVAKQMLVADGTARDLTFEANIEKSSWVAIRILAASHTNPVFIEVAGKPIRASKRSLEWCLAGVDVCWKQKEKTYRPNELDQARADYDHARKVYQARLAEAQ
jgi:hypothetical protein